MTRARNILGSDTASVLQELADSQISNEEKQVEVQPANKT